MLLSTHSPVDPEDRAGDKVQIKFPLGSRFARKLDISTTFAAELLAGEHSPLWNTQTTSVVRSISPVNGKARLSSKGSDYEDIW